MTLIKSVLSCAVLLLLTFRCDASTVTYDISGQIFQVFASPGSFIEQSVVSGGLWQGQVTWETNLSDNNPSSDVGDYFSSNGSVSLTLQTLPPLPGSLTVQSDTFTSGGVDLTVSNDQGAIPFLTDTFDIVETDVETLPALPPVVSISSVTIGFGDMMGIAFFDDSIPTSVNLTDLPDSILLIEGTEPALFPQGGPLEPFQIVGTIFSATLVPEPSTVVFGMIASMSLLASNRERAVLPL